MICLVGGVFNRREDVLFFQERVLRQDFFVGGPCRQQLQDVGNTNAESPNAGPSPAFSLLNSNPLEAFRVHLRQVYPCLQVISRIARGLARGTKKRRLMGYSLVWYDLVHVCGQAKVSCVRERATARFVFRWH